MGIGYLLNARMRLLIRLSDAACAGRVVVTRIVFAVVIIYSDVTNSRGPSEL